MSGNNFDRLTEKQRICLRMVLMHRSSKEIARELGIGADAVDQRLKTAMRTLGVDSRVEAARMLARHEGAATYQSFVYQPPDVVPEAVSAFPLPRANAGAVGESEPSANGVREEQASYMPPRADLAQMFSFPLPIEGGARNGLGTVQKLAWIVGIAIATAIGFGAFLSGLQALAQLTEPAT